MAAIFLVQATLFTAVLVSSTMGIEKPQLISSQVHARAHMEPATLPRTKSVINAYWESLKDKRRIEQEAGKTDIASAAEKTSPVQNVGQPSSAEEMDDREKTVIANRLKMVADLLEKALVRPLDMVESSGVAADVRGGLNFSDLPEALLGVGQAGEEMDDLESPGAWDERKILTGQHNNCVSPHLTGCYNFQLQGKFKGDVVSASLWFHQSMCGNISPNHRISVYQVYNRNGSTKLLAQARLTRVQDWLKMNITPSVLRWAEEEIEGVSLAFTCSPKNFLSRSRRKPLLVVDFSHKHHHVQRVKRSEEEEVCDRVSQCCKVPLTINPSELNLGFNDSRLAINYCFGSCSTVDSSTNHTMYRGVYAVHQSDPLMYNQLRSCCVPTRLAPGVVTSIENGVAVKLNLSHLKVLECGCL